MRRLDRFVGVPVCALLSAFRWVLPGNRRSARAPRRVLFVKLAEQGATILASEAIREAASRVGPANVHFLTFAENRPVLDALGLVPRENIYTVPTGEFGSFLAGSARALRAIHRARIDAAVDLEFFSRASAALAFLSGARARVGFHAFAPGAFRGRLHTHRVLWNPYLHVAQNFLNLVRSLGPAAELLPAIPSAPPAACGEPPRYRPSPGELERVRALLGEHSGRTLVLLNPNAGDLVPQRRWPAPRYAELARRLRDKIPGAVVVFTGTAAEAAKTEALAAQVGRERCVSVAGRTSFGELLALYTLSEVLVTNDSGPAHFASLTPVSTVALFGPESPRVFGPLGPRYQVLWAGIACSPCVSALGGRSTTCRDNRCLQVITVDQVLAAVSKALAARSAGKGAIAS